MKSHYDKSQILFGVPNGAEMSTKNAYISEETEKILIFANTGKIFTSMMAGAKNEEDFLNMCKEMYRQYKEKIDNADDNTESTQEDDEKEAESDEKESE